MLVIALLVIPVLVVALLGIGVLAAVVGTVVGTITERYMAPVRTELADIADAEQAEAADDAALLRELRLISQRISLIEERLTSGPPRRRS